MVQRVAERPIAKKNDNVTSYLAGENLTARRNALHEVWDILDASCKPMTDTELKEQNRRRFKAGVTTRRWTRQRLATAAVDLRDLYKVIENGPLRPHGSPTGRVAQTWVVKR